MKVPNVNSDFYYTLGMVRCQGKYRVFKMYVQYKKSQGFTRGSVGKESSCNVRDAGDASSIPVSERSPGGGHGNPLQYSCLENLMDRGAWLATVHRVAKSQT